jgi:hypothetical protein
MVIFASYCESERDHSLRFVLRLILNLAGLTKEPTKIHAVRVQALQAVIELP